MNILYISQYFPPEIGATQSRAYELCKNLVDFGHNVTVLTEVPNHPSGIIPASYRRKFKFSENLDGINVIRSWVYATPNKSFQTRMYFYNSFMLITIFNSLFLRSKNFDIIYATSPPLFAGFAGLIISKIKNKPFVFEVRDLWPESAIELGQLRRNWAIKCGHIIANLCYRNAVGVVGVTRGIKESLAQKRISSNKLFLIKNGTNPELFHYTYNPDLQSKLGWKDKFIVLYAGIHGVAQGLDSVLQVARMLSDETNIHFVFIGEGPLKKQLNKFARDKNINNVEFLPEVSNQEIPKYISLADVCLVPLKKKTIFKGALPSKIFDCWACGKPLILSVDGEARNEVETAKGGLYVEPENSQQMERAIRYLFHRSDEKEKMGNNGLAYVYKKGYIRSLQAKKLSNILAHLDDRQHVASTDAKTTISLPHIITRLKLGGTKEKTLRRPYIDEVPVRLSHRIKIMRIISRINIGGPAIHVNLLHNSLNQEEFESTLISGSLSSSEGDMSYIINTNHGRFHSIPEMQRELHPWKDMKALFKFLRIIQKEKPHIVHSHTAKAGTIARIAVTIHNFLFNDSIKTIHTFHGHVFNGYFSKAKSRIFIWIERFLSAFTNKIITISPTQYEELVNIHKISKKNKIESIKLGFNFDTFSNYSTLKGRFRKELGIDQNTKLVGMIGRLVPIKNHIMFLSAIDHYKKQHPNTKDLFVIVGDGELRAELENFCLQKGITEYVRFCGWVKDIRKVYADLDALVLTSINEGTPVSIIEAMASRVPVISTDAGGVKDLLGNSIAPYSFDGFRICQRGLLLPKNDSQSLADAINFIFEQRDLFKSKILPHAQEFVLADYHQDRLIQDIRSLYIDLLT